MRCRPHRLFFSAALAASALLLATAGPALAGTQGPDYIASDNVEFVKAIKSPSGLTAGARVIGKYLYVTSSKDLEIFDISTPEDPKLVGSLTANIQFENEEVPTNGKLLGISSDLLNSSPECLAAPPAGLPAAGGCLRLYDVRDPTAIKELPAVAGAGTTRRRACWTARTSTARPARSPTPRRPSYPAAGRRSSATGRTP